MDFRLSEEQQRLQQKCRELAADFAIRSAQHDRDASHPIENYQRLRDEGFLALTVARKWGGAGATFRRRVSCAGGVSAVEAFCALRRETRHF